jgi:hypothetical protein
LEHIVHIWRLQIFFLLMMWRLGPNFLFKKIPFCTSPNPHWWRVRTWNFFLAYLHPYS